MSKAFGWTLQGKTGLSDLRGGGGEIREHRKSLGVTEATITKVCFCGHTHTLSHVVR